MSFSVVAPSIGRRLTATIAAIAVAFAGALVAAPAQAADTYTISGSFTIPSSGVQSSWTDMTGITIRGVDSDYWAAATIDFDTKTFVSGPLEPGTYTVRFGISVGDIDNDGLDDSSGLLPQPWDEAAVVEVTNADVTGITYDYQLGATVAGTVTLGAGADPEWLDQVEVSVSIPGPEGCNCGDGIVTGVAADGSYIIRGVPKSSLTVQFRVNYLGDANLVPEFWDNAYSWEDATRLDFASGNKTGIDATLDIGRTISGVVTVPSGATDDDRGAVNVVARGADGTFASADVDPVTGAYTITGLTPTTYTLEFDANDYYLGNARVYSPLASLYYGGSYTEAGSTTVDLTTATSVTGKNQLMVIGRTISGTVTLGSGIDPVWKEALAAYAASDAGYYRSAAVDATTGAYTIRGLAPDSYTVNFDGTALDDGAGGYLYDDFAYEYYNNARSPYAATPVSVASGNKTGINATMDLQVGNREFWVTPVPTITGTATAGSALTAVTGTWEPYAASFTYQWKRNGVNIADATAKTYTLTQADATKSITVAVTGSSSGFTSVTKTSAATTVAASPFATAPTPTISGTAAAGQTLTAVPGAWSPSATFTYQWLRNGSPIGGATTSTYAVTQADATKSLSVTVTGAASGYVTTAKTSATVTVAATPFTTAPPVSLSGAAEVGSTLTANTGSWSPEPTFAYVWLRNGDAIPGATGPTYTLVDADGGQYITLKVVGSAPGYADTTRVSAAVVPTGRHFTATPAPTVSGSAIVGKTLTANVSAWTPAVDSFGYAWLRDGAEIDGANAATYVLTGDDYGHAISVRIEAHLDGYERDQATSAATPAVAKGTFVPKTPIISGSSYWGATLTATVGTWTPAASTYTYQWYRNGVAISGAKAKTYKLTSADSGKKITVKVTGTRAGYTTASKTSASKTLAKFFTKVGTPSISGTVKVGYTLTANRGTWSPAPSAYSYQWYRNGVAISGATKSTYKAGLSDAGKQLTVRVTAKRSGYASQPRTSAAKTVAYATFKTVPTPTITGTLKVGSRITANRGTWSPAATTYTYQWYRSGVAISGATSYRYTLTSSDKGKQISVKVTGKRTGYATTAKFSARSAAVK